MGLEPLLRENSSYLSWSSPVSEQELCESCCCLAGIPPSGWDRYPKGRTPGRREHLLHVLALCKRVAVAVPGRCSTGFNGKPNGMTLERQVLLAQAGESTATTCCWWLWVDEELQFHVGLLNPVRKSVEPLPARGWAHVLVSVCWFPGAVLCWRWAVKLVLP